MTDTLLRSLRDEHHHLADLLTRLEYQLYAIQDGLALDYDLLQQVVHYLCGRSGANHFPVEERLFSGATDYHPALADAGMACARQHERLKRLGDALADTTAQILAGQLVSRRALVRNGLAFVARYRRHLVHEENELLVPMAGQLDAGQWQALHDALAPTRATSDVGAREYDVLAHRLVTETYDRAPGDAVERTLARPRS